MERIKELFSAPPYRHSLAYRDAHLQEDLEQAIAVIVVTTAASLLFIPIDYFFYGFDEPFKNLLIARLVFTVVSIVVLAGVKRHNTVAYNDYAILAWYLSFNGLFILVNVARAQNFKDNLLLQGVLILGGYILLPNRFLFKLIPALFLSASCIALLSLQQPDPTPQGLLNASISVLVINLIGAVKAIHADKYRRANYYSQQVDELNRRRLLELSRIDTLTGLLNRRHFLEVGELELKHFRNTRKDFCFVIMDINGFKKVNDSHGHPAGDHVLKEFSTILMVKKREHDKLGRLGGDEIGILLPETTEQEAHNIVRNIYDNCSSQSVRLPKGDFRITFGYGIAQSNAVDRTIDDIYRRADARLYLDKKEKKEAERVRVQYRP